MNQTNRCPECSTPYIPFSATQRDQKDLASKGLKYPVLSRSEGVYMCERCARDRRPMRFC